MKRLLAMVVSVGLLAAAPSASALTVKATNAPIGSASSGSYVLTVGNMSASPLESVSQFLVEVGPIGHFAPAGVCETSMGTFCTATIAPGGTLQLCYSGVPIPTIYVNDTVPLTVSQAPAVDSCPVPGFKPGPAPKAAGKGKKHGKHKKHRQHKPEKHQPTKH